MTASVVVAKDRDAATLRCYTVVRVKAARGRPRAARDPVSLPPPTSRLNRRRGGAWDVGEAAPQSLPATLTSFSAHRRRPPIQSRPAQILCVAARRCWADIHRRRAALGRKPDPHCAEPLREVRESARNARRPWGAQHSGGQARTSPNGNVTSGGPRSRCVAVTLRIAVTSPRDSAPLFPRR
jgi:hypothetical protein